LTTQLGPSFHHALKRNIFTAEIGVQTDASPAIDVDVSIVPSVEIISDNEDRGMIEVANLTAGDLAAILQWSQTISSDINLSFCELLMP
jgi:hypothetical protein